MLSAFNQQRNSSPLGLEVRRAQTCPHPLTSTCSLCYPDTMKWLSEQKRKTKQNKHSRRMILIPETTGVFKTPQLWIQSSWMTEKRESSAVLHLELGRRGADVSSRRGLTKDPSGDSSSEVPPWGPWGVLAAVTRGGGGGEGLNRYCTEGKGWDNDWPLYLKSLRHICKNDCNKTCTGRWGERLVWSNRQCTK